jgi:hypothetical protein
MFFGGGDPFEHFAHAHGGGGGGRGGGGARRPAPNVDTTKLYETLDVSSMTGVQVVNSLSGYCLLRMSGAK